MAASAHEEAILWHDLLGRLRLAEHRCDVLVDEILNHHNASHSAPARWCPSPACRLADEFLRQHRGY
jgi:hypothetical protein